MEYVSKSVESPRGLSQEQALVELQNHPKFKLGSKIESISQRHDRWLIKLLEPKTAVFPPAEDDDSDDEKPSGPPVAEESDDDSDDSDDSESPFPPKDKDEGDDKEKGELGEVLGLLHKLLGALGLDDADVGPDAGPPPPPPGPPGAGGPPGADAHGGARPGAGRPPTKPLRDVPPGANPISGFASAREMATQIPTFTAKAKDDGRTTVKTAKAELEGIYGPHYKVKQIKRDPAKGQILALLSVR